MRDDSVNKNKTMPRRDALKLLGSIPLTATRLETTAADHAHVSMTQARGTPAPFEPKFFTAAEWKTANLLADMIIPRDERSGSASEGRAVEYIDEYAVFRGEGLQTELRGGLMWLDRECSSRFEKNFVDCTEAERKQILDAIAYPEKRTPENSHAVAFFNRFRDLTATGFYTSKIGIADLGYSGNRPFDWQGCPDAVLSKLDLK